MALLLMQRTWKAFRRALTQLQHSSDLPFHLLRTIISTDRPKIPAVPGAFPSWLDNSTQYDILWVIIIPRKVSQVELSSENSFPYKCMDLHSCPQTQIFHIPTFPSSISVCRRPISPRPSGDKKEGRGTFCRSSLSPPLCLPPPPVCPPSDGWLLVLASSDREICHLMPGKGDSKSISMETAVACRLLSRPLGAGFFFASHLSDFSLPLFYTRLSKSSFEQTHLAPIAYPNLNSFEFVCYCPA